MAGKKIERIDHIDKGATYKDLFFIGHYSRDYPAYQHPHRHNYYEVLWLPKGAGDHYIDGTKYPITGTIYF